MLKYIWGPLGLGRFLNLKNFLKRISLVVASARNPFKYLGLNEVDGDFYSGVNVTDDAASKI